MSKNYIIKHYKRIVSAKTCDFNEFDFITFGSFDGIKLIESPNFSELQVRSLSDEHTENKVAYERIISCERQKMYLYPFDELPNSIVFTNRENEKDEFFLCADKNSEEPIIVMSTIGLFSYSEDNSKPIKDIESAKEVQRIICSYMAQYPQDSFSYRVFGTLIPNSVVVVFRGKTYASILNCLEYIEHITTIDTEHLLGVSDIYSVYGISKQWAHQWHEEVFVRFQLVVTADFSREEFEDYASRNGLKLHNNGFNLSCYEECGTQVNLQPSFGKYDIEFTTEITDVSKFIGFVSVQLPQYKQVNLFRTTLYVKVKKCEEYLNSLVCISKTVVDTEKNDVEYQQYLDDLQEKYFEISTSEVISPSMAGMLCRLIIRISQTLKSINTREVISVYIRKILAFLNRILCIFHPNGRKDSLQQLNSTDVDAIVRWVKYINTILDNNIIDYYIDFEKPQREPSFLGTASVVLCAYQKYVDKVLEMLKIDELISVTVDIGSEINMSELLNHAPGQKQYFIKIPCEIVFSAREVLLFITHEIIHRYVETRSATPDHFNNILSYQLDGHYIFDKKIDSEYVTYPKERMDDNIENSDISTNTRSTIADDFYEEAVIRFDKKVAKDLNTYIYTEAIIDILTIKYLSGGFSNEMSNDIIDEYLYCCVKSLQYRHGNINGIDLMRYYCVWRYYTVDGDTSLTNFLNVFQKFMKKYSVNYGALQVNKILWNEEQEIAFNKFKYFADNYISENTMIASSEPTTNNKRCGLLVGNNEYRILISAYTDTTELPFDTDLNLIRVLCYGFDYDYHYHLDDCEDKMGDIVELFRDVAKEYLTSSDGRTATQILNQYYNDSEFFSEEGNTWDTSAFIRTIKIHTGEFSVIAEVERDHIRTAANNLVEQYKKYINYFVASNHNKLNKSKTDIDLLPLDENLILAYLDAYTELLKSVYICNVNEKSNPTAWILEAVFHFGYLHNPSNTTNIVTKYCPFVISALYMFVKNLEQYKNSVEFSKLEEPEQKRVFARIFAANAVCRLRRYNIYVHNNEQTVELMKQGSVGTVCCAQSPNESASIRDVRPVRIVEKVYMGFKDWKESKRKRDQNEFSVGVVGNIKGDTNGIKERINEFIQSLYDCLRWDYSNGYDEVIVIHWYCAPGNTKIEYDYHKKSEVYKGKIKIYLHNYSKSGFTDMGIDGGTALTQFISNNDLIFFIDSPLLYRKHEFIKQKSSNYFRNYIFSKDTTYSNDYCNYSLAENLYNTGLINSLMTNISGQGVDNSAEYGKLVHRVNTMVTEHIRRMAEKSEQYKSVFMLLSSETAISETDYDKRNIVRVERYDSKSFDVVNFTYNHTPLKLLCDKCDIDNTIVMTLYQLVKNIDRGLIHDELVKACLYSNPNAKIDTGNTIKRMRGVYIGLEYDITSDCGIATTIKYYIDEKEFDSDSSWILNNRQKIYNLIYNLISIVYQSHPMPSREYLSLYTKYRVNFFTAIFSSARTVGDMLYLHLLRDKANIVHLKESGENGQSMPKLKDLKKYELHIDKKFFDDTIWVSDQTKNSFDVQSSIISNANELKVPTNKVISKLIEECERFNYDNSYLYKNMKEALGMIKDF